MVKAGQFREDLWFWRSVFPIRIPPLRERTSDIPELLQYFIREKRQIKTSLQGYVWAYRKYVYIFLTQEFLAL
jgi:transcriptional regulator with GAF, ATPase, and Fis domain